MLVLISILFASYSTNGISGIFRPFRYWESDQDLPFDRQYIILCHRCWDVWDWLICQWQNHLQPGQTGAVGRARVDRREVNAVDSTKSSHLGQVLVVCGNLTMDDTDDQF